MINFYFYAFRWYFLNALPLAPGSNFESLQNILHYVFYKYGACNYKACVYAVYKASIYLDNERHLKS